MDNYYLAGARYRGRDWWLLWCSPDDGDDWVLCENGHALSAQTADRARDIAWKRGIELVAERERTDPHRETDGAIIRVAVDFDAVRAWLHARRRFDADMLISSWDFAGDLARGLGLPPYFATLEICDKLFATLNIPVIVELCGGRTYTPTWSKREIARLTRITQWSLHVARTAFV